MIVPSIAPAIAAAVVAKRMREYNAEMDRHESWLGDHGYETYSSYDYELDENSIKFHKKDVAKRGFWNRILCDIGFVIGIPYIMDALSEKSNSNKVFYLVFAIMYSFLMILWLTLYFRLFGFIVNIFQYGVAGGCVGTIMTLLFFVLPGMCWIAHRWEYIKWKSTTQRKG